MLKVAIIGCGKIADGHVEEIAKLGSARVAAVCDLEILMAEQVAARYGIAGVYDDADKMLEKERPDVVHIATPPQTHLALAVKALDAGCHLFVEKPVGIDAKEVQRILQAAERAGKKLTVGYTYRFDPPAEALRKIVREGVIGEAVHAESYYGYDLNGVFGRAILDNPAHWVHGLRGGIIQNNLDHVVNKIAELVPDENPQVGAVAYRRREAVYGDSRDAMLDELRAVVVGKKTSAYATFSSHGRPAGHFLRVYGTDRTVHVDFVSRSLVFEDGVRVPGAIGRLLPPFERGARMLKEGSRNVFRFSRSRFHFFAGLNRLLSLFYQSIIDGSEPPVPYGEILRTARLMDRIMEDVQPASRPGRNERP